MLTHASLQHSGISARPVQLLICTDLAAIGLEALGHAHDTGVAAGTLGLFNTLFTRTHRDSALPELSATSMQLLPAYAHPPVNNAANHVSLRMLRSSANRHIRSHAGEFDDSLGCGSAYPHS